MIKEGDFDEQLGIVIFCFFVYYEKFYFYRRLKCGKGKF
jgi:hypothetical protein